MGARHSTNQGDNGPLGPSFQASINATPTTASTPMPMVHDVSVSCRLDGSVLAEALVPVSEVLLDGLTLRELINSCVTSFAPPEPGLLY